MSTRAIVHFKDAGLDSETIVTMYRHSDGYPEKPGLGFDIWGALNVSEIINGISGQTAPRNFNGMACLAAWLIGELKGGSIGGVYLYPPDTEDIGEAYVYTIYEEAGGVGLKIEGIGEGPIGQGPLDSFDPENGTFYPLVPEDERFSILSSDALTRYAVTHVVERWTCECADHIFRRHDCKHIREARGF